MNKSKLITKAKKLLSGVIATAIAISMMPTVPAMTEETTEKYPYTLFAASSEEGAITINADNFCVNGDVATNGTIVSSGSVNINGKKTENANEYMIYILKKLNQEYFTGENVDVFSDDYSYEAMNININEPMDVKGELELDGNINLNTGIKALDNVILKGEVKNTNDAVICSETGDIIIDGQNINLNGLVYAPYGNVEITGQNLNLNNVIIIADTITFNCSSVNANYSDSMAELVGTESDVDIVLYAFGEYNCEENAIEIEWYTNYTDSAYTILISDDNITYNSVAVVEDAITYQYLITEDFETRYFKISLLTNYGETFESVPFVMKSIENGYVFELLDSDGDGLADIIELMYGTDVNEADTDMDNLTDYQEICLTGTDPLVYSSVTDGVSDAEADSDGDGLSNEQEIEFGTNPQEADTDEDGLNDDDEIDIYGTDPILEDTDGDGLKDGDEPHIGLDPTNPETFDVPDSEYKVAQDISADSEALSKINTSESPYKLSISITAAGYVEGNLTAKETSYSKAIQNDAMLGVAPELIYSNADYIDSVTLKFEISPEYLDNTLNMFPDEEELTGIKRLNVFKYFEDINMLIPIETQFDTANNVLYANVDELGTYCVMDLEIWLNSFDVPEEEYQTVPVLMSSYEESETVYEFTEEDTKMTSDGETEDMAPVEENIFEEDSVGTQTELMLMSNSTVSVTPIDVAFLLQTSGELENTFDSQRVMIADVMDSLIEKYGSGNVRFCVITYSLFGATILKDSSDSDWFTSLDELENSLDEIVYEYTDSYTDRSSAFKKLQNDVSFRENASKFIFQVMNGPTNAGSTYFDQINTCARLNINYSELMPAGYHYTSSSYGQQVANAIASTNGMNATYSSDSAKQVFNHICTYAAPPQVEFEIKIANNWKTITLDGILDENNGVNSDTDDLTDWEEVNTDMLSWDTDGSIILPTVQQCFGYTAKSYVENGLSRLEWGLFTLGFPTSPVEEYLIYVLDNIQVLPIYSDPTDEDTDGDGLLDGTPQYYEIKKKDDTVQNEEEKTVIAPADPDAMSYTGPENLWINQINEMKYGTVPTDYLGEGKVDISVDKATADALVGFMLKCRDIINDNDELIRNIALGIKNIAEGNAAAGAYLLNFVYDEDYVAYHSQSDTWQRAFGYNALYDDVFRIGSYMNYGRIDFYVDGVNYALWTWKGDYWNLQSGAEVGLYVYNEQVSEESGEDHYDAVDFEVPMTLSLYNYQGDGVYENIYNWVPEDEQWWITGFNPEYTEPNPDVMVSVASVDLSGNKDLFDAILQADETNDYRYDLKRENLIIDEKTQTVWIQWYNEGEV